MIPNRTIVRDVKKIEKSLYIKWNNEYKYFEVWRKKITGDILITPVTEVIYDPEYGQVDKYERLDRRIISWLISADSRRSIKKWRWLGRKMFDEKQHKKHLKRYHLCENIAKDSWNLVNPEFINPLVDVKDWLPPDLHTRGRISHRSHDNAKKFFGREE